MRKFKKYIFKMGSNYICNSNKYTLGGQTGDTIALPVTILNLPDKLEVEGNILLRKTSFHVSLVCIGQIIKKHSVVTQDFVEKVINDFCEFIRNNEVSFVGYRDEFRFVEEGDRKSIVVMCDISNLDKFFDILNKKYQLTLEHQPTHLSLFTLQPDKAIFLTDSYDLKKLSRVTPRPNEIELIE